MELHIPNKLFMTEPYVRFLAEDADSRRICETVYKIVSENKKAWRHTSGQTCVCIKDKDKLHNYPIDAYYKSNSHEIVFY